MKIKLNIKNHGELEFDSGITTNEIAKELKLESKPFLGKINDVRINPNQPITESGDFKFRLDPMCACA